MSEHSAYVKEDEAKTLGKETRGSPESVNRENQNTEESLFCKMLQQRELHPTND